MGRPSSWVRPRCFSRSEIPCLSIAKLTNRGRKWRTVPAYRHLSDGRPGQVQQLRTGAETAARGGKCHTMFPHVPCVGVLRHSHFAASRVSREIPHCGIHGDTISRCLLTCIQVVQDSTALSFEIPPPPLSPPVCTSAGPGTAAD